MTKIRFDGQVAIVTGGAGGLGRQYALDLARRGARVVINDIATSPTGEHCAQAVVDEISGFGGQSVADNSDVGSAPHAIVENAIDSFGSADVLINNAGVAGRATSFHQTEADEIARILGINLIGAASLCRAVWPHMVEKGYGRIVNVTSHSIFGAAATPYMVTRAGHLGLTAGLATEGASVGIKVNCVMPAAFTPMTSQIPDDDFRELLKKHFDPSVASPAVLLLASQQAPCTGQIFHTGGGLVARLAIAIASGTRGISTPEQVLENFEEILDMSAPATPSSVGDVMAHVFSRVLDLQNQ